MLIKDIIQSLEEWAPQAYQASYDNARLICGSKDQNVRGVLCTLDCTEDIVEEAIAKNCNLIVAHHPILFRPLKSLTGNDYVERTIIMAIKNDIAIFALHTNLDSVSHGVNLEIGRRLGLESLEILSPANKLLSKLITFAPQEHANSVRKRLFEVGGGTIGNYDHCSFNSDGIGTFRGNDHSNPFVGEPEKEHLEKEVKIEVVFPSHLQVKLIRALKEVHPYEEVAFDVFKLENAHPNVGSGMIGAVPNAMEEEPFLKMVAEKLESRVIRHTPLLDKKIKKVAFCGGAGSFLLEQAKAKQADVLITSDFKYHEFFDADKQLVIMDVGHFESEQYTPHLIKTHLDQKFSTFAVLLSEVNTNPVQYFIS